MNTHHCLKREKEIATREGIEEFLEKVLEGGAITRQEAVALAQTNCKQALYEAAHRITRQLCGNRFDTCSIINVKQGNCLEDCKWCAQSKHFSTGCQTHDLLSPEECSAQARYNHQQGINRFSLVAVGRTQSLAEIDRLATIYRHIGHETPINCCASLGLLNQEKLKRLYQAGVTTYHCNMEASPSYFKKLVTTHSQAEKEATIRAARAVGMRVCSGGIIGMGESVEDRIDLALYLRSLGVESIPINVLHPIAGTPLAKCPPLSEEEYLTTIALFRFINPTAFLRFSGGRIQLPLSTVRKAMYIGINAAITGDMLTTRGTRAEEDMRLLQEMGYTTQADCDWEVLGEQRDLRQ